MSDRTQPSPFIDALESRTLLAAQTVGTYDFTPLYGPSSGYDIAVQDDQKTVTVGSTSRHNDSNSDIIVIRKNADETYDKSFAVSGIFSYDVSGGPDSALGVAIGGDCKIVVAGQTYRRKRTMALLMRLNADGSLDSTFGAGGIVTLSLNRKLTSFHDAGIFGDTIVVTGAAGTDIVTARFDRNGALDKTFSDDGIDVRDIGGTDSGNGLFAGADGRVAVAAGTTAGSGDIVLLRYRASGALDTQLNKRGIETIDYGHALDRANVVVVDDQGRIVIAGTVGTAGKNYPMMARLSASGKLDRTFAARGWLVSTARPAELLALARFASGKFRVGGTQLPRDNENIVSATVSKDGKGVFQFVRGTPIYGIALDAQGTSHYASGPGLTSEQSARASRLGPGNKLTTLLDSGHLTRLNPDGSTDLSYGSHGWSDVVTESPSEYYRIGRSDDLYVYPDGSALVLGTINYVDRSLASGTWLAKYLPNGHLDKSFGTNGIQETPAPQDDEGGDKVDVLPDGSIMVATEQVDMAPHVYRLSADGRTTLPLGYEALVKPKDQDYLAPFAAGFSIAANGDITIYGAGFYYSPWSARMHADGSVDTSIGTNGIRDETIGDSPAGPRPVDPIGLMQLDGTFLHDPGDYTGIDLVRHNADGSPDPSFGIGGHVKLTFGDYTRLVDTRVQSNGKILVIGVGDPPGSTTSSNFVTRLDHDGSIDNTFGTNGTVFLTQPGWVDQAVLSGNILTLLIRQHDLSYYPSPGPQQYISVNVTL